MIILAMKTVYLGGSSLAWHAVLSFLSRYHLLVDLHVFIQGLFLYRHKTLVEPPLSQSCHTYVCACVYLLWCVLNEMQLLGFA